MSTELTAVCPLRFQDLIYCFKTRSILYDLIHMNNMIVFAFDNFTFTMI